MNLHTLLEAYQNQIWVIGVSGGPDSLALLDLAYYQGLLIEVVHVHYHKRASADQDAQLVLRYCKAKGINHHQFDAPLFDKGNFQQSAREFRYACFKEVALKTKALGVMTAHHLDDHLETYVFQKQRQTLLDHYGIRAMTNIKGMQVVRPLLDSSKDELIKYCQKAQLVYGLDETNLDDAYTRNRIRKQCALLSLDMKQTLLRECEDLNRRNQQYFKTYQAQLEAPKISMTRLKDVTSEWPDFFSYWLRQHTQITDLSLRKTQELLRQVMQSSSIKHRFNEHHSLTKQYGHITIMTHENHPVITLSEPLDLENAWIKIYRSSRPDALWVDLNVKDFPITIVCGSTAMLKLSLKQQHQLRRAWINHKIPDEKREIWPLFFNESHHFITTPLLRQKGCLKTDKIKLYVVL